MKKNNKKGFTLVELVIVVAVMAVLVAVAIPTVGSIVNSAEDATYKSNCRTIESMLKLYQAEQANESDNNIDGTMTVVTLEPDDVEDALDAAALGIDNGTFSYNTTTGEVAKEGGDITITYEDGVVSAQ